ncbi:hypothetical protein ABZ470_07910 [Streptosporangium sp. NPDC020072]
MPVNDRLGRGWVIVRGTTSGLTDRAWQRIELPPAARDARGDAPWRDLL